MPNTLPEFEHPPLDEVILGVQFEPLQAFHAAHVGLYWSRIRDRYPATEEQPPLVPQVESEQLTPMAGMAVGFGFPRFPRIWFVDASKNQLIQLQSDRFLRNWRRLSGTDQYPRYATLAREFRQAWEGFLGFLEEQGIGRPNVNQCELTYINNLEPTGEWQDISDLEGAFTLVRRPDPSGFLPTPEVLTLEASYKLPRGRGRLHVAMQPGFRGRDLKLIQALNLTARGAPESSDIDGIFAWLDMAHEWIVRGFDELTVPEMHKVWGKKS